jgi:PilZ domain
MSTTTQDIAINPTARRSDRISLEIPIQVVGSGGDGKVFVEDTRTVLVSRHGAKILLWTDLIPEQEITISCPSTGKEAPARVVGRLEDVDGRRSYGVAFLDSEVDLWDIEFPPLAESEQAVGRVLLECMACHSRQVTYLDDYEAETLESSGHLSRPCKRCGTSLWKVRTDEPASLDPPIPSPKAPSSPEPVPVSPRASAGLRMRACLRHPQFGDEIVTTESVSRGGLSFRSAKDYDTSLPMQVAVPFLSGAANIFAPVHIERKEFLPAMRLTLYTLIYIPVHKGWPAK